MKVIFRSVLFLLFYAAGSAVSVAYADTDTGLKMIIAGDVEDSFELENQLLKLRGTDNSGSPHSGLIPKQILQSFTCNKKGVSFLLEQRNWVYQRPLYLLFHSFLFYDLL